MATMVNSKLTQEIVDEFLTCKVCYQQYRNPKSLSCLHTFCVDCLDKHISSQRTHKYGSLYDFPCPICRKHTPMPSGGIRCLPDNFLVVNLKETIGRRVSNSKLPFCEFCRQLRKKISDACAKCLDCQKLMCGDCVETHRTTKITKNHTICDVETEKDIECKVHPEEVVRFYCEKCEKLVCILCTFEEHGGHDVSDMKEGAGKQKESIDKLLSTCNEKLEDLKDQLGSIEACSSRLQDTERRIKDRARELINEIRCKEKVLIHELRECYGAETMDFLESKSVIKENYESLRKNLKLAESLKEKEVEFLFVKKDLEEKLKTLATFPMRPTPPNITKKFEFNQGPVDLGSIRNPYDSDEEDEDDTEVKHVDAATGTEEVCTLTRTTQTLLASKDVALRPAAKFPKIAETQTPAVSTTDAFSQIPNEKQQKLHVNDNQGIAILPNGDLLIIDSEDNKLAIMDKRGRSRYTFGAEQLSIPDELHLGNVKDYHMDSDKHIRIYTPHGHMLTCFDGEVVTCLPLGATFDKRELFR